MRILLSCLQDLTLHEIPAYRFWRTYFRNALVEGGHEVVEVPDVDWAEGCTLISPKAQSKWRGRTWQRTVTFVAREQQKRAKIDLFLSYLYPHQVEEQAVAEIQRQAIPCVNFFCDNVREYSAVPPQYRCFDLHWVPEFEAVPMYRRAGLAVVHAPMPVWVPAECRDVPCRESPESVFIGSHDALRQDLLGQAIARGAAITVRGPGWQCVKSDGIGSSPKPRGWLTRLGSQLEFVRQRGVTQGLNRLLRNSCPPSPAIVPDTSIAPPVWGEGYVRVTRESEITLGINRVPTFQSSWRNPLKYSRLRDIEAPMMGACYLTEWTEGISHLYDLGTEIETYETAEEMAAKILELRQNATKRKLLRERGQRRALTELTVGRSMEKVAAALF